MSLEILNRDFEGFIFDCDGTLVNSMPLHYEAWRAALIQHGAPFDFTEEMFYSQAGIAEVDTVMALNREYGCALEPHGVMETKMAMFYQRLNEIQVVETVATVARQWAGRRPMAVASGSEEITVRSCLEITGLLPLFPVIVTPVDVAHGKPAPDLFLLAAEKLGVNPAKCLVFEDGMSGVCGARAAGMEVVWVERDGTLRELT
jgi:beta-phosphoglucomutase family hydrolase